MVKLHSEYEKHLKKISVFKMSDRCLQNTLHKKKYIYIYIYIKIITVIVIP
jgi:hypothetical protein